MLGFALMIASFFFIGRRLMEMQGDLNLSVLTHPGLLIPLLLLGLGEGIVLMLAALNYRGLVANISGIKVKTRTAMRVYAVSNLYKYIPSGVMYVLGRNRMAIETKGLSHGKVALATLAEGIFLVLAAVILTSVYSFDYFIDYIRQFKLPPWIIFTFAAMTGVLIFFRRYLQPAVDYISLHPVMIVKRLVCALVIVSLWGISFAAALLIMGQPLTFGLGASVAGLFILSWLAGYLTPGAPSGIGIREVVLFTFMGGVLDDGILLSTIVIHRALQVAGDIAAYGIALGYGYLGKDN